VLPTLICRQVDSPFPITQKRDLSEIILGCRSTDQFVRLDVASCNDRECLQNS